MAVRCIARRDFLKGAAAVATLGGSRFVAASSTDGSNPVLPSSAPFGRSVERRNELVEKWNDATGLVAPKDYFAYMRDGDTRGFKALAALEQKPDPSVKFVRADADRRYSLVVKDDGLYYVGPGLIISFF